MIMSCTHVPMRAHMPMRASHNHRSMPCTHTCPCMHHMATLTSCCEDGFPPGIKLYTAPQFLDFFRRVNSWAMGGAGR